MKERTLALAAIAAVAILVDCGGGGGGSAVTPSGTATAPATSLVAPAGTLKASLKITVPHATGASSSSRSVKMIPSNTQSIVFTLVQTTGTGLGAGATQGPFGLTATSPGCAADGQGNVTCTLSIDAPIGTNIFTADIYSSTNAAAGTRIGSGAVQFAVAQNAANTTSISLNGPISQIYLTTGCPSTNVFYNGGCIIGDETAFYNQYYLTSTRRIGAGVRRPQVIGPTAPFLSSTRLFVIALDASGNVIVNPTVYDQPVTLEWAEYFASAEGLVQLSVSYASVSLPFVSGPSASTTTNGGTVQLWSPLDVASVSIVPNVNAFVEGYVFSGIGTATPVPLPIPSTGPSPSASTGPVVLIGAAVAPSPTPSPTPTASPTPGPLYWTDDQGNPSLANGGPSFTAANGTTNPTQFTAEFGQPAPSPSASVQPVPYTFGIATNYAYAGPISFSDGGSCSGILQSLPGGITGSGTPFTSVAVPITLIATVPATCTLTATDGTNTSVLTLYVNQANVIIQGHRRQ